MATQVIQTTFENTYKDDFRDSDNYYKVLFNNGRALQQRELNQVQSIIQSDFKTNADFTFRHGSAASGGGFSAQNKKDFIKLNQTTNALPSTATSIEGIIFTEATTGIKFRVDKVTTGTPAVIHVTYTDNGSGDGTTAGIVVTPGLSFTGTDSTTLTSQTTNTTLNPAIGFGTLLTVASGKFYIDGHFVFTPLQSLVVSKFTTTPDATIGFKVTEEIYTTDDDNTLFDNSGATLNTASPGADRYRISLTLIDEVNKASGDYFIPVVQMANGRISKQEGLTAAASGLENMLATRTREESGSYTVNNMLTDFETNADSASRLDMIIGSGTAYVNGYRKKYVGPSKLTIKKPRQTQTLNNTASAISFGNFVKITTLLGVPPIATFGVVNLRDAITHGGNTIGTARVRSVEKDGSNHRFYLFDIKLLATKNFGMVRSIGTSTIIYGDVDIENTGVAQAGGNVAFLHNQTNNNLFFPLSKDRSKSLSDIVFTAQHILTGTADGSGNITLTAASLLGSGHIWDDTSQWFATADDDGVIDANAVFTPASDGSSVAVTGLTASQAHTFVTYAQKGNATVKAKTLTTAAAAAFTPAGDGSINLAKADIFDVVSITDVSSVGGTRDISDRYILDNGARDNFYDIGKLILKGGKTAPTGNVNVSFRHFTHGVNGDFFAVNSYNGQVAYEDIPSHRQTNGQTIQLRDVIDFRPTRADASVAGNFHTGTGSNINVLPQNNDLLTYDLEHFLGQKGISFIGADGRIGIELGRSAEDPDYPTLDSRVLKLARVHLFPYMLSDQDCYVEQLDNRRYTMRDIGSIEKRLDQLEESVALNMLELQTTNLDVFDSAGNTRLKAGITADNFNNHFQSDTTLSDYRAAIDPAANELRPKFVARPIGLVFDSGTSSGCSRIGDKVMLSYTEAAYQTQADASRFTAVNPYGSERMTGTITMSPASDPWFEQNVVSTNVTKGDASFSLNEGTKFGDWDFNWSGVTEDQVANFKTGDIIGDRIVNGGTYQRHNGNGTATYQKRTSQSYTVSGLSTKKEVLASRVLSVMDIPFIRSRFISFRVTGMRPNTQVFGFFGGINISTWMNTTAGTGAFVRMGSLPRSSPYLEVYNIYGDATTYPSALGSATTKMITDSNGAVSGYFLLPRTSAFKFKTGQQIFTLLDISAFNPENATTIAKFTYEASGILQDVDQDILETRVVQYGSLSSQLADAQIGSYQNNEDNCANEGNCPDDGKVTKTGGGGQDNNPNEGVQGNTNDFRSNDMMTNPKSDENGAGNGTGKTGPQ